MAPRSSPGKMRFSAVKTMCRNLLNKTTMAAARVTLSWIGASDARAACGDESLLRREVRYEPDVRGTIGRAKMLRFPRVYVARARGRTTAPSPWRGRRAGAEFVGRGSE